MFERFTERARQVVVLAQQEALELKHSFIGTEHILLGLLREEEGVAARVLERFDITAERVREQIVRIIAAGEEMTPGQSIPFTPRSKQVFELALREALSMGHNYIGTEHILLAVVRENEGVAMRILNDFDADADKIRGAVQAELGVPMAHRQPHAVVTGPRRRIHGPGLDWRRATLLWRPEGLELRVPLHLNEGSMATFAADEAWSKAPLEGMRRELWAQWLGLASPTLLEDVDPSELRRVLDAAAQRALDRGGRDRGRVEDFLRLLRTEP
jgi:hypothetical protein